MGYNCNRVLQSIFVLNSFQKCFEVAEEVVVMLEEVEEGKLNDSMSGNNHLRLFVLG